MSNELSAQDLLPPEIGLTLLGFEESEQGWLVHAEGRTRSERPACGTESTARHSRYWRNLQDLPVQGKRVALRLRLSRWRCRDRECEQAIFRERLGEVVLPWARRTSRVEEVLLLVGHRTGGRAAEFLLKRLAMAVSDDTILRRIKGGAREARHGEQRLRVVGVDDWAWKKGQTYGTVLVDLERRTVADLLPQRSADQLAEWLKQHPEVEFITRDRFGLYAGGARRGEPQARQVADRFHLLLNLREAVEKELARQRRRLALPPVEKEDQSVTKTVPVAASCSRADPEVQTHKRQLVAERVEGQGRAVCAGPSPVFKRPEGQRHRARDRSRTPTRRQVDSMHATTDQERDGTETNLAQILCHSPTTSMGERLSQGSSPADRNPRPRLSRMLFELSEISCSLARPRTGVATQVQAANFG
jgi:hypothetical protein